MTQQVTKKTAYRGLTVTVTLRNGKVWTGTLDGFGTQLVAIRPDEESKARNGSTWKVQSFAHVSVESITKED